VPLQYTAISVCWLALEISIAAQGNTQSMSQSLYSGFTTMYVHNGCCITYSILVYVRAMFTIHCGVATTDSATSPCMIPAAAFSGSPIAVAAGAQHSLILTDSGSVHACGSNEFG
jgi:Regulator of chromosome condensation (RCC1) repeat